MTDRAIELLTQLMADPEVSAMFNCQQLVLQHSLPLGCYLLKPVQRVLKYQLLLQVLLFAMFFSAADGRGFSPN